MIKAVLLDIDNTLLDFDKCAANSMAAAAEQLGLQLPENSFPVFRRINDRLWQAVERNELTRDRLHEIRFPMIFEEWGLEGDALAFEQAFLDALLYSAEIVEGAPELVDYLAGKYILCAASNAPFERQRHRLEKAGFLPQLEKIFTSGEIGYSKPQREFFDACMAGLPGLKAEEILMLGDSLTADIAGARAAGMQTCWFNYDRVPVPELRPADYVVEDLAQVRAFL